jgi:hypothetical protein
MRACQREGLFRIERDRQGVMRLFAGNVMQPVGEPGPIEDVESNVQDSDRGDESSISSEATGSAWAPPLVETEPESDVVDGAVVQEIEVPSVIDVAEAAPAEATTAEPAPNSRSRGRRRAPGEPRAPRKAADHQAAASPRPRKPASRPRTGRGRARTATAE